MSVSISYKLTQSQKARVTTSSKDHWRDGIVNPSPYISDHNFHNYCDLKSRKQVISFLENVKQLLKNGVFFLILEDN